MRYVILALAPVLLTGCVAALADDEDVRDVEYWLKTNDATTRIGTAMQNREIIEGMTKTHVKLVMPTKSSYDALPTSREKTEDGNDLWIYVPNLNNYSTYRITFGEDGKVSSVETVETEDKDGIDGPRGTGE
jgi:hypothetical protein